MPCTEAQLRAAKKWRENHRDLANQRSYEWKEVNIDKQREYARKCMKRRYDWNKASMEFFNILL